MAKAAEKRRGQVPEFLRDAPQIEEGLDLHWDAFSVLTTTRQIGQGVMGPIPWDKIMDYASKYDLDEEQGERMVAYIRAMDTVYLDHFHKKLKDRIQSATSGPSSPTSKG